MGKVSVWLDDFSNRKRGAFALEYPYSTTYYPAEPITYVKSLSVYVKDV